MAVPPSATPLLAEGGTRMVLMLGVVATSGRRRTGQHPEGQMPRDMRLTFRKTKRELKTVVETMIGWNPELSSLRTGTGTARTALLKLRRAFRWLLDG
jgi:hypothetical protein